MALAHTQPAFWADGHCRDLPAEWFHPERGESTSNAKAVCASCPVQVECPTWALSNNEKFGIWGGTSERERRRIRRTRALGLPDPPPARAHGRPGATPGPDTENRTTDPPTDHDEEDDDVDLDIATAGTPAATNGTAPTLDGTCVECGKPFAKKRKDQRFHTPDCARRWYASHPASSRTPKTRRPRPVVPLPTVPVPAVAAPAGPVDLQVLLGQLLAGCDRWHVEADVGDVHVIVSRQDRR